MSYDCNVKIKGVGNINCSENSYVNIMNLFNTIQHRNNNQDRRNNNGSKIKQF